MHVSVRVSLQKEPIVSLFTGITMWWKIIKVVVVAKGILPSCILCTKEKKKPFSSTHIPPSTNTCLIPIQRCAQEQLLSSLSASSLALRQQPVRRKQDQGPLCVSYGHTAAEVWEQTACYGVTQQGDPRKGISRLLCAKPLYRAGEYNMFVI